MAASLLGSAAAQDIFVSNSKVFSGIAGSRGEGLIVPQTVISGGHLGFDTSFDAGSFGNLSVVTTLAGGPIDSGLGRFPNSGEANYGFQARAVGEPSLWGVRPYVGFGVGSAPQDSHVFQGVSRLLPYDDQLTSVHGVAGLAYELMPGVGAGVEYRYQGVQRGIPNMGVPSEDQSIMVRLDLGLN